MVCITICEKWTTDLRLRMGLPTLFVDVSVLQVRTRVGKNSGIECCDKVAVATRRICGKVEVIERRTNENLRSSTLADGLEDNGQFALLIHHSRRFDLLHFDCPHQSGSANRCGAFSNVRTDLSLAF